MRTHLAAALSSAAQIVPALCIAAVGLGASALVAPAFGGTHFESAHVHPVDISPDGSTLFTVHTADHRLTVWDISGVGVPVRVAEIPVGVGPVSVRARTNNEVWVVNHISDDISVVDVLLENVVATLQVGDEPSDVVFAGTPERAFVSVSRTDEVVVLDPANRLAAPNRIALQASLPRSLAVSQDGTKVYVAVHDSGNQTSVVSFTKVTANGGPPAPVPPMDPGLPPAPETALIVKHNGVNWVDETGTSWDSSLPFTLQDNDVIAINVATQSVSQIFSGVGTTLMNVAVNPADGSVWVTNQDAMNEVRFERVIQGQFVKSRVTRLDTGAGTAVPHHLNAHINYGNPSGDAVERSLSLAIPTDVQISSDGSSIYVAAFGSAKVGVLNSAGAVTRRIPVGNGPSGLALDEANNRLFVVNRHTSSLSVVDLTDDSSVELSLGYDPTPANILAGRTLFYNGENSSAHGDLSCASCHVFGGADYLAWDLGDPLGAFQAPPPAAPGDTLAGFHPMKGPMTTQTARGLEGTEPFHWRGDKDALLGFNGAFVALQGRATPLSGSEFQLFEDFVFSILLPPNPHRELDNSLPTTLNGDDPSVGETFFNTSTGAGGGSCLGCHINPSGNDSRVLPEARVQAIANQDMTIPQLRTMYTKIGFDPAASTNFRGFGTTHNGQSGKTFPHQLTLGHEGRSFPPEPDNSDLEAFLLCFDTGTHPVVGAQWTMDGTNEAAGIGRLNTMLAVADGLSAGVIAKGRDGASQTRGWVYLGGGSWESDRLSEGSTTTSALLTLAGSGTEITFTGVLAGTQFRHGVDRDGDGYRDRDELDEGSDPGDPGSIPGSVSAPEIAVGPSGIRFLSRNPTRTDAQFAFSIGNAGAAQVGVYDVQGRLVRTLYRGVVQDATERQAQWDLRDGAGRRVGSGTYFVRLLDVGGSVTKRVTVLR
ncbi:MAG: hypothetical protein DHS20C21_09880 [Gemmatimonadota bacterium]|nr:MAG: hypothetical protein DHS20C21_09880 [Gemmatimonadota bacterium]